MPRTTLVGLDGSVREEHVLREAADLAGDATLYVCRAVTVPVGLPDAVWSMSMSQLDTALVAEAETSLAARLAAYPNAIAHVRIGQPADVICDLAKELGADLVVIGAHGYGALERLLGTTASKVVHRAHCSVLVVRDRA